MFKKVKRWVRERFYSFRSKAGYVTTKVQLAIVGAFVGLSSMAVFAEGEPVDFGTVGTTVSAWAGTAATAGVTILTLIIGVRVMKRVFKTTAS